MADVRGDWWPVLVLTPIAVPVGAQLGSIGLVLMVISVLAYPIALRKDAQYVRTVSETWNPSVRFYTAIGIATVLTAGILSYFVSPVFLYRRFKHV